MDTPPRTYSAFWPIVAVFLALIVLQSVYVAGDFGDRSQIRRAQDELAPLVGQAQKITQVVEDLGKDLITLSTAKNAEAAKIVADLNIKMNESARR
jgi:hypothetical protein